MYDTGSNEVVGGCMAEESLPDSPHHTTAYLTHGVAMLTNPWTGPLGGLCSYMHMYPSSPHTQSKHTWYHTHGKEQGECCTLWLAHSIVPLPSFLPWIQCGVQDDYTAISVHVYMYMHVHTIRSTMNVYLWKYNTSRHVWTLVFLLKLIPLRVQRPLKVKRCLPQLDQTA